MRVKYAFKLDGDVALHGVCVNDDVTSVPDGFDVFGPEEVWNAQHLARYNSGEWSFVPESEPTPPEVPTPTLLETVQSENEDLKTRLVDIEMAIAEMFAG